MAFHGFQPLEANFTPTPNQFFDEVIRGDYPKCVIVVVAVLIRQTLGWQDAVTGERRIETELALSQIAEKSGLSINSARQGIREAIAAGFVVETASHDNRHGARYAIRWTDTDRQKEAVTRQRLASRDRLADIEPSLEMDESGGANFGAPKFGGQKLGAPKFAPNKRKSLVSKKEYKSKKKSLNVSEAAEMPPTPDQIERPTPNERETDIYRAEVLNPVDEAVDLTGDAKSRRRWVQLREICVEQNAAAAWIEALAKTRQRLEKGGVAAPGAYLQVALLRELDKRGITPPSGTEEERDDVRGAIGASLGLSDGE
jgi:hypothetical protein